MTCRFYFVFAGLETGYSARRMVAFVIGVQAQSCSDTACFENAKIVLTTYPYSFKDLFWMQ